MIDQITQLKEYVNSRLTFEEEAHHYELDKKPITGATTVLGVIHKPALIPWAWKLGKEGKDWKKTRDRAGDIGTLVHKEIEGWINKSMQGLDEPYTHENEQVFKMVNNFIDWAHENNVEFLASELRVFSETYWYCGTLDFLCKINGKLILGDLKTSSGIYNEMFYQTSAYQNALEETWKLSTGKKMPKISKHVIVNCKKDGKIKVAYSDEYTEDRKAFMGALAIFRRQQRKVKKKQNVKKKTKK